MAEKETTPKKTVLIKLNKTKKKVTIAAPAPLASATPASAPPAPVPVPTEKKEDKAPAPTEKAPTTHAPTTHAPTNKAAATLKQQADRSMHNLLKTYLDNITKDSDTEELELEVKFGTRGIKSITRINYDNIIKKLLAMGFTIDGNVTLLRIQNEFMDPATGTARLSSIRTEINGLQNVRKYCQSNSLSSIDSGVTFIQKNRFSAGAGRADTGGAVDYDNSSVEMNDFNFRVSLSKESKMHENVPIVRSIIDKWNDHSDVRLFRS